MTSGNVRSIQGEQQGELIPAVKVKFVGLNVNDLGRTLKMDDHVTFSVEGTVVAAWAERISDGGVQHYAKVKVGEVECDDVTEPERDPELPLNDDVAEG